MSETDDHPAVEHADDDNAPAWPGVLVAVAIGVTLLLSALKYGPGASPDSTFYLSSAKYMLMGEGHATFNGEGEPTPIISYAPLYPLILAGLQKLGLGPMAAATTWAVFCYAALVLLAGRLAWLGAGGDWLKRVGRPTIAAAGAAVFAAVLLALSPDVLWTMSFILTDGGFAVLILAVLLLLGQWITHGGWWRVALFALLAAASYLLRYAGLFIIAYVLGMLFLVGVARWWSRRRASDQVVASGLKQTVIAAIVVAVLSATAVVGWSMRNSAVAANDDGSMNIGRSMSFHPPTPKHYSMLGETARAWVLPETRLVTNPREPTTVGLLIAGIVPGVLLALMTPRRRTRAMVDEGSTIVER
ncbi:MAG: hypothetical protein AAGK78_00925 [Planctomycetota bacterium]